MYFGTRNTKIMIKKSKNKNVNFKIKKLTLTQTPKKINVAGYLKKKMLPNCFFI